MIDSSTFKSAMRKVVESQLPEELDIFDLEAEGMIDELYLHSQIKQQPVSGEFAFADTAKNVLEFVGLLAGTFTVMIKVVKEGKDAFGKPWKEEDLRRDLELELLRQGLKPKKASVIADSVVQKLSPSNAKKP